MWRHQYWWVWFVPYWASPNAAHFHSGSNSNMPYLAYFQDFQFLISDFHHIDFDRAQFIIHVYICTFSLTGTESVNSIIRWSSVYKKSHKCTNSVKLSTIGHAWNRFPDFITMSEILPNFTDTTRVSLSSADNIKIGEFFTGLNIGLFIDLIHARARRTFDILFKNKGYLRSVLYRIQMIPDRQELAVLPNYWIFSSLAHWFRKGTWIISMMSCGGSFRILETSFLELATSVKMSNNSWTHLESLQFFCEMYETVSLKYAWVTKNASKNDFVLKLQLERQRLIDH